MCHFLSFAVSVDGKEVYASNLRSHQDLEKLNNLKPGSYRECEWVGNTQDGLTVRRSPGDHDESWYKASILGVYRTMNDLLHHFLLQDFKGNLNLSGTHIKKLPDDLKVGGDLDLSGTQIKKLSDGLKVGGNLNLSGTHIKKLPDDLKVGGDLDLICTQIKKLSDGLKVGGRIFLSSTQTLYIPKTLKDKIIRIED